MQVSVYQTSWTESPSFLPVVAAKKSDVWASLFCGIDMLHTSHCTFLLRDNELLQFGFGCVSMVFPSIVSFDFYMHSLVQQDHVQHFRFQNYKGFPHRQWLHYVRNSPGQVGEGAAYAILLAAGPKGQAPPHVLAWLVLQPLREEHWSIVDWVLRVGYGHLKDLHQKSVGWILIPGMKTDWHAIWTGYWGKFDSSTFLLFRLFF